MAAPKYSLPFKTLVGQEVALSAWHYRLGNGDWLTVASGVPGWDYLAQLEFRREVQIDAQKARIACGLDSITQLELIVTMLSPPARFRRVVWREKMPKETWVGLVTFQVPSEEISEYVSLDTEIILSAGRQQNGHFTARYAGSRLFAETTRIELEGNLSRMSLEMASFAKQLPWLHAPRAPWYVECGSTGLHGAVMRDLRVYLNSDDEQFLALAKNGNEPTLWLMSAEIARQLLEVALEDQAFLEQTDNYEEGTLGQAAQRVLRLCFQDTKPSDVLTLARRDPGRFQAILMSNFRQ